MNPASDPSRNILIADHLADTPQRQREGYVTHALCRGGSCTFRLGTAAHSLAAGDCLIFPQTSLQMSHLACSDDFRVEVIYVAPAFITNATPQSNYGMRGHLALFENPVMHLNEEQQQVCALNFDYIRHRLSHPQHHFHRDAMLNAVQCMIIDFYDFHVELYGERPISNQQALLMQRFLAMLERGDFRRHRDVPHYASELCVTPKYLSEVCRKTSGEPAIYWITRFTALDISRQLRRRDLTLEEVSSIYGFSSLSYFVRYVHKHLGSAPGDLRE